MAVLSFPVVGLLLVGLTALLPLALASPPDAVWLGGVFDGGDYDDVVVIATSAECAAGGPALDAVKSLWPASSAPPPAGSISAAPSVLPAFQGRSPPIA